jgi:hypothetical protein
MNIFFICLAVYLVWLGFGIWYFFHNMGKKNAKEPWYAWPLLLPVLSIAYLLGIITKLTEK